MPVPGVLVAVIVAAPVSVVVSVPPSGLVRVCVVIAPTFVCEPPNAPTLAAIFWIVFDFATNSAIFSASASNMPAVPPVDVCVLPFVTAALVIAASAFGVVAESVTFPVPVL